MQTNKALIFLFIFIGLLHGLSFAQDSIIAKYPLRHEISPEEKAQMVNFHKDFSETEAPSGLIRSIAEWEPMESVLIAYDNGFGIPISAIAKMSEDCKVSTLVNDAEEENTVRNLFAQYNVNLDNCEFIHHIVNSWWVRDYSPWYISINQNEIAAVNFPYNRPRPNDNDVPLVVAGELDMAVYGMNLTHTGGNYMSDGYGTAASTDLVLEEETLTETEIKQLVKDYLGVNEYHITADPLGDYIKHIDCWGKFLSPNKILITQVPADDPRYSDYEAVADYFANSLSSWGYPYEVIRVQAPHQNQYETNPYTNSLILNKKVFVPISGSSYDADAIEVYKEAMPGYEIISVYSSGWYNSDALHCRTHGIADRQMFRISHRPILGEQEYQSSYTINAATHSYGKNAKKASSVTLYHKTQTEEWTETQMTSSGRGEYSATITSPGNSFEISYYLSAENSSGDIVTHPLTGSYDPHTFYYSEASHTENYLPEKISVYPNPTRGNLFVKGIKTGAEFSVYNTSGIEIKSGKITGKHPVLKLSGFPSGLYFIKIQSENGTFFKKALLY
jgi:agmatine/peptidylarginine deiminase